MSWRYSTGLRNALLEQAARVPHAIAASTISFGDGDGSGSPNRDTINDSGNGLAGFLGKSYITSIGSVGNDVTAKILSVAAGIIEVAAGVLVDEVAGAAVILATSEGGSYRGIFRNMVLDIRTGTQPSSADNAETGDLLCRITLGSGAFVPGSPANGINFGQVEDATLGKELDSAGVAEVWSGLNVATGIAGHFRIYNNAAVQGASTEEIRLDGACATSGAQLNLTNTSLSDGVTTTIDQVVLVLPAS